MQALVRMLKIGVLGIATTVLVVSALSAFAKTAEGEAIAPLVNGLGNHTYPASNCSGTAQAFFDQGLQLFYAFRYPESLASFREAARLDPDCAMTHWGAALAIAPTPNSRHLGRPDDPTGAGAVAIRRAGQLMAEAPAKEQGLIQALARVYDQVATPERVGRDLLYVEAMLDLYRKYPTDHEIATLYSAALMTKSAWDYWTPDGKPRPGTLDAVTALNGVLNYDLQHPGANHLFIHLLEDSQNPEDALPHAERLADMMTNVGHMVHMPTHIYIRTGLYQKAIDSNVQSIDAANSFITAWGDHDVPMGVPSLSSSDRTHASHAMDFIHMAAVLQGNAATSIDTAKKIATRSAPHLALTAGMQRRFAKPMLTYRRYAKWDSILELPDPGDLYLLAQGLWHFVRGSAFVNTGKVAQAELELATLAKIADLDEMQNVRAWVNSAASLLDICELVLNGEIATNRENYTAALRYFAHAIRIEDSMNYMEPPDWGHPVRHDLGALLLTLERPAEAETVFWEDLRRNPENGWALHGVWQSLIQQGKSKRAAEVAARFERAWADADVTLHNGRTLRTR